MLLYNSPILLQEHLKLNYACNLDPKCLFPQKNLYDFVASNVLDFFLAIASFFFNFLLCMCVCACVGAGARASACASL